MKRSSAKTLTIARTAAGYAAATACGYAASLAHVPLAWLLGPLLLAAGLSVCGVALAAPQSLRRAGQVIIGCTAGLNVTASVAAGLLGWIPVMVVTTLFAILVSGILSPVFGALARVDDRTSFFALMPGGLAEMGNIGIAVGARMEPIALVHTLRIAVVVFTIPPLLARDARLVPTASLLHLDYGMAAAVIGFGALGAAAVSLVRINNPWMIGALVSTAVLAVTGVVEGRMPALLFAAGQILLGYNIGTRFKREILLRLPRVAIFGAVSNFVLLLVMAGYALCLSYLLDIDPATAILVSSPGGISEMTSTAQAMHLPVALVTAFHVVRSVLVNGFATHFWGAFERSGYIAFARNLMGRPSDPV
ncbi:MAG: AbrB family transcriptional regulator [Rhizobiaceae bacterium]|nr:AbrB family transcriptional regulator [Rhizobiaceae bacterium]